jgi:hypothetical protein
LDLPEQMLTLLRDAPESVTDDMLMPWVTRWIKEEAGIWSILDCAPPNPCQPIAGFSITPKPNPVQKAFIFEWQTELEKRPDLADGPLLDVYARQDADWSFVTKEPGWDDQYDNPVQVFMFSHDNVVGREPTFAAHELLPVFKQHLLAVAAREPKTFSFAEPLAATYDFASKTFKSSRADSPSGDFNLLGAASGPPQWGLPDALGTVAVYSSSVIHPGVVPLQPQPDGVHRNGFVLKVHTALLPDAWRTELVGLEDRTQNQSGILPPLVSAIALDRQVTIPPIPMDPTRAEALTKKLVTGGLTARVYVTVDRALTFSGKTLTGEKQQQAALVAHVLKVDVIASSTRPTNPDAAPPDDELLATYD